MFNDVLIYLSLLSYHDKVNVLSELPGDVEHDTVHLLEGIGKGHHPHGHDHILQICGHLGKLGRLLLEVIKVEPRHVQIRALEHHGLRDYQLPDQLHELIHLAHVYADKGRLVILFILCKGLALSGILGFNYEIARCDLRLFGLRRFFDLPLLRRRIRLALDLLHAGV